MSVSKQSFVLLVVVALAIGLLIPVMIYLETTPSGQTITKPFPSIHSTTTTHGSTTHTWSHGGGGKAHLEGVLPIGFKSYSDLYNYLRKAGELAESIEVLSEIEALRSSYMVAPTETVTMVTAGIKGYVKQPVGGSVKYSSTNIQVIGVDELDYVKTNGKIIAVSNYRNVYVINPVNLRILSNLSIGYEITGLYLVGDKLVVIASKPGEIVILPAIRSGIKEASYASAPCTRILVYDITDPSTPKQLYNVSLSGSYVSSRLINNIVYIITSTPTKSDKDRYIVPCIDGEPLPPGLIVPVDPNPSTYTTVLALDIETGKYSATSYLTGQASWIYMSQKRLYLVKTFNIWTLYSPIQVIKAALDMLPPKISSIIKDCLAKGDYKSAYEEFRKYLEEIGEDKAHELMKYVEEKLNKNIIETNTTFYVLEINGINMTYKGNFTVPGRILDQFSMEELDNEYFVVATTVEKYVYKVNLYFSKPTSKKITVTVTTCTDKGCNVSTITMTPINNNEYWRVSFWGWPSPTGMDNRVYIIRLSDLKIIGSLEKLAPGEKVYAARLVDHIFYLVTYRRVDPLFAIDVSNPEKPRILGYLKIPGFSEYLHPLGKGLLLGVGREDSKIKISLFNVTDPENIREIASIKIGPYAWSRLLYDHHAFTIDPDRKYIYIPIQTSGQGGILVVSYANNTLKYVKILEHPFASRTIYIEDTVYTISRSSIKAYKLPDFTPSGEIEFGTDYWR